MAAHNYRSDTPYQLPHRRRYHHWRRLALMAAAALLAATGYFLYDLQRLRPQAGQRPVGAAVERQIAGPKVFTTPYFRFSDSAKWELSAADTTATKFTYLLQVSGVPAHSVTVYINQTPNQDDLATNRVLPVQVAGNRLTPTGGISDNCGRLYAPGDPKRIKAVSLAGTTLLCVPDTAQYLVAVGQVGGDYRLRLKRANGETATYIILYHNLSIMPEPAPFERLVKTFQAL